MWQLLRIGIDALIFTQRLVQRRGHEPVREALLSGARVPALSIAQAPKSFAHERPFKLEEVAAGCAQSFLAILRGSGLSPRAMRGSQ